VSRIDIHCHFQGDHPEVMAAMAEMDLKMLNLAVPGDEAGEWRKPLPLYEKLAREHPESYAWCSGMDVPRFDDPDWADGAISNIERDVKAGAVGVKIWKNVGMEVLKPDGSFVQVDDPVLEPVFSWLETNEVTVLAHLAEPLVCWAKETTGYYKQHPEWWMYDKPDHPSHAEITAARDRVVERHPGMRFVGAHLASLEFDLGEIARRLDACPNFAVGVGGRFGYLAKADRAEVQRFFSKYRDRIMFSTDNGLGSPASGLGREELRKVCERIRRDYGSLYRFHETAEDVEFQGRPMSGLELPADVLECYYEKNARAWFPGI